MNIDSRTDFEFCVRGGSAPAIRSRLASLPLVGVAETERFQQEGKSLMDLRVITLEDAISVIIKASESLLTTITHVPVAVHKIAA